MFMDFYIILNYNFLLLKIILSKTNLFVLNILIHLIENSKFEQL